MLHLCVLKADARPSTAKGPDTAATAVPDMGATTLHTQLHQVEYVSLDIKTAATAVSMLKVMVVAPRRQIRHLMTN